MPSGYVQKVADMAGASIGEVEKFWKQAKEAAGKSYSEGSDKFWGTVTKIFKAKASKHLGVKLAENNFEKTLEIMETKFGLVGKFLDKPSAFKKQKTNSTAMQVKINRRKKKNRYRDFDNKKE